MAFMSFLQSIFSKPETVYVEKVIEPADYRQLKIDVTNLQHNLEVVTSERDSLEASVRALTTERGSTTVYPRNFTNLNEIKQFLSETEVDKLEYVTTKHDCEDFALELQQAGLRWKDGVFLGLQLVDNKDGTMHMKNIALVGNKVYSIEPQTDVIKRVCDLD